MWDTIAYYESRAGTTTHTPVAGLADDTHSVNGDDITIPTKYLDIISTFAALSNATDVIDGFQLSSPSLRATSLLDNPILRVIAAAGAYTPGFPFQANMYLNGLQAPRKLTAGEKLNALVRSSAATAADLISAVVMLGDGNYANPLAGQPVETLEFTTATPAVANTWTTQALTPSQTLRAGRYAVVGMEVYSTTGKCGRLIPKEDNSIFPGSGVARPGVYPVDRAVAGHGLPHFRLGNMGILCTFTQDALPSGEMFATAADTAATTHYYLDIAKIG